MLGAMSELIARQSNDFGPPQIGDRPIKYTPWSIAFLAITNISLLILFCIVRYTYEAVIGTLLAIESPSTVLYVPVPKDDDADESHEPVGEHDPEQVTMIQQPPITSSIFKAEEHLVARAGSLSRFRGFSMWISGHFAQAVVENLILYLLPSFILGSLVATVIAHFVVSPLRIGWNHIVISEPNPKYWFQRIPSSVTWKKVAIPYVIFSIVVGVGSYAPVYLSGLWDMKDTSDLSLLAKRMIIIEALGLAVSFFITFPARAILARINASVLSEEEETIVPFDRSFGGKFIPEIVGGRGVIGILDAWKTFPFQSKVRLVKFCAKIFLMKCVIAFMWAVVLTGFMLTQSELTVSNAMTMAQNKFSRFV